MAFENESFRDLANMIHENTQPVTEHIALGSVESCEVAYLPQSMKLESLKKFLDEYKTKPDRRAGTATADTTESFCALLNRFKAANSAVFAKCLVGKNAINARLTAILDYHPGSGDNTAAAFAQHRVTYDFPLSADFTVWLERNAKPMSQLDFAVFIEDGIGDLAAPEEADHAGVANLAPHFADPATMLALSRDLEIYASESFKSKTKLSSGETELKFSTEHVTADGKPLRIPDFFVLNVPIFEGAEPQRIVVRLRYRVKDGAVIWFYEMYRLDRTFRHSFEAVCAEVTSETALPLYLGAPEAKG